jgi:hypothetical protein
MIGDFIRKGEPYRQGAVGSAPSSAVVIWHCARVSDMRRREKRPTLRDAAGARGRSFTGNVRATRVTIKRMFCAEGFGLGGNGKKVG